MPGLQARRRLLRTIDIGKRKLTRMQHTIHVNREGKNDKKDYGACIPN